MKTFILYYREGCHLCDDMRRELYPLVQQKQFALTEVDIDIDDDIKEKYNVKVPVLCLGGEEICHHFFDKDVVQPYLD